MLSKKSQGISLNVIVIAIIGLLVLVVLVIIFTGKINVFGEGSSKVQKEAESRICATYEGGGKCATACSNAEQGTGLYPNERADIDWIDCSADQMCCYKSK